MRKRESIRKIIAIKIVQAIANCFYIYLLMIVVRCFLTWIPGLNWDNPILKALRTSVDLYLDLFRKFIPPLGFIDLSPIVATFVLILLRNAIVYGAVFIFSLFGWIG